ncbi:MAG: hypothetical protein ABIP01_00105, partial [Candidatus Limnocylindria bacterium]
SRQNQTGFGVQPAEQAPEQLRYLNPIVGMLDIVSRVEIDGPTRFTRSLYELFGQDLASTSFSVGCDGLGCEGFGGTDQPLPVPVDAFGQAARADYWWPRVAVSFLIVAAVLTLASMRLVVPAGMRWAFRRGGVRRMAAAPLETKP